MEKARAFTDVGLNWGMFELNGGLNYDYWTLSGHQSPCTANVGFCPLIIWNLHKLLGRL